MTDIQVNQNGEVFIISASVVDTGDLYTNDLGAVSKVL